MQQKFCFSSAPGAAPNGSTPQRRRQPVNDPDKEDQSQRNSSGLVPRIVIHGKNQRRTDAARAACRQVYEAFRYSDPVSAVALTDEEQRIAEAFDAFSAAIAAGEDGTEPAETLSGLLAERNAKCKAMK